MGIIAYSASKAALNSCFQSLRLQYRNDNIGFVLVLPGPVKTELLKASVPLPFTHQPKDEAAYIVKHVFNRTKQIEPSWLYATIMRTAHWVPDWLFLKLASQNAVPLKKNA